METRVLSADDIEAMWAINEQGLPGTGQITRDGLVKLLNLSDLGLGVYDQDELVGFVVCMCEQTTYGSLNYAWFNERFDGFVYVDRIAVAASHRQNGIGSHLYQMVLAHSDERAVPVAAEVNLDPPNPGSMRFHQRFGFEQIGCLHHSEKSVAMLWRTWDSSREDGLEGRER